MSPIAANPVFPHCQQPKPLFSYLPSLHDRKASTTLSPSRALRRMVAMPWQCHCPLPGSKTEFASPSCIRVQVGSDLYWFCFGPESTHIRPATIIFTSNPIDSSQLSWTEPVQAYWIRPNWIRPLNRTYLVFQPVFRRFRANSNRFRGVGFVRDSFVSQCLHEQASNIMDSETFNNILQNSEPSDFFTKEAYASLIRHFKLCSSKSQIRIQIQNISSAKARGASKERTRVGGRIKSRARLWVQTSINWCPSSKMKECLI